MLQLFQEIAILTFLQTFIMTGVGLEPRGNSSGFISRNKKRSLQLTSLYYKQENKILIQLVVLDLINKYKMIKEYDIINY